MFLLDNIMADRELKYIDNAEGKYYVDQECIDCDLCREVAPTIYQRNDNEGHSFVVKQPEGNEEEEMAKEALDGCPVEAIGNDGLKLAQVLT